MTDHQIGGLIALGIVLFTCAAIMWDNRGRLK